MTEDKKPELKIEFAPGCFDDFDGTQEELDEFIAELKKAVEDGSLFEGAYELTDEELDDIEEITVDKLSTRKTLH